jgi:hypothetical protein
MHEHVRLTLSFLKTIRWWLVIQSVTVAGRVSTRAANWIGERSALNDALIACLARLAPILRRGSRTVGLMKLQRGAVGIARRATVHQSQPRVGHIDTELRLQQRALH